MRVILVLAVALTINALDCPDSAEQSRTSRYHRERLRAHWMRMRALSASARDGNSSLPPAIWWWNQPAAWGFYRGLLGPRDATQERKHGTSRHNYRYVLEDMHPGGRLLGNYQSHVSQEILLSTKHKIAYVNVRKSGSQAVENHMWLLEATAHEWCLGWDLRPCKSECQFQRRCSSLCLEPSTHLSGDYLFFSFVQHPVRRFFKGAVQAKLIANNSVNNFIRTLRDMQDHGFVPDHHLETQSFSLSPFTPQPDSHHSFFDVPQLQMDFIGRVEHMSEDWAAFVEMANDSRHHRGAEEIVGEAAGPIAEQRHWSVLKDEDTKRRVWNATMTPQVLCLAHEVFAQDIVSFGYGAVEGFDCAEAERQAPPESKTGWP